MYLFLFKSTWKKLSKFPMFSCNHTVFYILFYLLNILAQAFFHAFSFYNHPFERQWKLMLWVSSHQVYNN